MSVHKEIKKVTTNTLLEMKRRGEKIAMLTAYDYTMAKIIDSSGVDVILVGDSASNVLGVNDICFAFCLYLLLFFVLFLVLAF